MLATSAQIAVTRFGRAFVRAHIVLFEKMVCQMTDFTRAMYVLLYSFIHKLAHRHAPVSAVFF